MRGIERRIAAGLDLKVDSVASLFVSRWDVAVKEKVPPTLRNRLGIAIAKRTYKAYRELLASPRWRKLAAAGARPQRLLWASTGTKDPDASDTLYIEALAAPDTINTMPDKTLIAFADHGQVKGVMPVDGGDAEEVLAEFKRIGVDDAALADQLQREGTASFDKSWRDLLECIATKGAMLRESRLDIVIASSTSQTQPLTERPAWKTLSYRRLRERQLWVEATTSRCICCRSIIVIPT